MEHVFKQMYHKHFAHLKMVIKGNNSVCHKIMHNINVNLQMLYLLILRMQFLGLSQISLKID